MPASVAGDCPAQRNGVGAARAVAVGARGGLVALTLRSAGSADSVAGDVAGAP
jgi:hypothetical protein